MQPSDLELASIWRADVLPRVFARSVQVQNPVTVFLGGQPGAGKTKSQQCLVESISEPVTPIVGDDFRQYHPDYHYLVMHDPIQMPDVTAHASGTWIGMCVDYANTHHISTIIEGTWRNPATVLDEAARAKHLRRRTLAVVVAVPPVLSRLGILNRYCVDRAAGVPARWTPISAHEQTIKSLGSTVEHVVASPLIDRFAVMNRAGDYLWSGQPDVDAVDAFQQEFSRTLTADEIDNYEPQFQATLDAMKQLESVPEEARQTLEAIQRVFSGR